MADVTSYAASLTYRDPLRTEFVCVTLNLVIHEPLPFLERPTELPGVFERFELIHVDEWEESRLAGYVFIGWVDAST